MGGYRKIHFPKCPYCNMPTDTHIGSFDYSSLVGMINSWGTDDVVIKCKKCNEKYRVTVAITYHSRKLK